MTIIELIKVLEKFESTDVIVIKDADTDWLLNISDVEKSVSEPRVIVIYGNYTDEYNS